MRWFSSILILSILLAGCTRPGIKDNKAEPHYILGLSFLQEGNPTLALKEFLRAETLDPRNADIQAALGQAYQLKRAYAEAEFRYLRALKLRRGDPQIQNNLGALYLDMQRWDDAAHYFRQAAGNLVFTQQEVALTGLGMALFQKGEVREAVSAYLEALLHEPRYARARLLLGEAYLALDKTALAIAELQQVVIAAPDHARAHYQLGLAYLRQPDPQRARQAFHNVVRLAPQSDIGRKAGEYLDFLK